MLRVIYNRFTCVYIASYNSLLPVPPTQWSIMRKYMYALEPCTGKDVRGHGQIYRLSYDQRRDVSVFWPSSCPWTSVAKSCPCRAQIHTYLHEFIILRKFAYLKKETVQFVICFIFLGIENKMKEMIRSFGWIILTELHWFGLFICIWIFFWCWKIHD